MTKEKLLEIVKIAYLRGHNGILENMDIVCEHIVQEYLPPENYEELNNQKGRVIYNTTAPPIIIGE